MRDNPDCEDNHASFFAPLLSFVSLLARAEIGTWRPDLLGFSFRHVTFQRY
jgi:hypothetical protein